MWQFVLIGLTLSVLTSRAGIYHCVPPSLPLEMIVYAGSSDVPSALPIVRQKAEIERMSESLALVTKESDAATAQDICEGNDEAGQDARLAVTQRYF